MTMDADQWMEHDDTYENGDTLDPDIRQKREQKKDEFHKGKVATGRTLPNIPNLNTAQCHIHPLPNRYATIRRPPKNANRGQGVKQPPHLDCFRYTTACLGLVCILLLGVLLGLSFYYERLSLFSKRLTEEVGELQVQNSHLEDEIRILKNISRSVYQVSSYGYNDCSTGLNLFVLNYEVLEKQMEGNFYLSRRNLTTDNCSLQSFCNCTPESTWSWYNQD
ncbi:uncharacterized protein LOC121611005 [Chelmon rostratus]|uniref:uncharacterized protein LOC121611005 n=1 Tax=Chelmon rostratus TaxID=109905 RepID=UPI001BEBE520|nr:uncharacterized protein LOC121611005 [Chelmon rostratus]